MISTLLHLWGLPYIRWHILFIFLPSLVMWLVWGKYFLKYKQTILFISFFSFIAGAAFDLLASPVLKVWYFDRVDTLHIWFWGLPLEEYLFLLLFPQEIAILFLLFRKWVYGKHG